MKKNKIEENEVEILDTDIVEVTQTDEESTEVIPQTTVVVTELLKKNNELLEYHNTIMKKNTKMTNMNAVVNMIFKIILIPAVVVLCLFLYKIYTEMVLSNQKETKIVNNLPQQETPVVNVNVPKANVEVKEQAILDKVSFYRGGFYGFVYKNTSNNIVYCKTKEYEKVYDVIISPNATLELTPQIYSCKDAELIEIKNPNAPKIVNKPYFEL